MKLGKFRFSRISQKCHLTLQTVAPGGKACCVLSIRQSNGSPLSISTSLITCKLTAKHSPQPADCTIMNVGPGTDEIKSSPVSHFPHHLRVMVEGVDIPGSEFSVPILRPSPETRGLIFHTIQGIIKPLISTVVRANDGELTWRSPYHHIQEWTPTNHACRISRNRC